MNIDTLYLIALRFCPNVGDLTIKKLRSHFGSAKNIWNASSKELTSIFKVGEKTIRYIGDENIFKKAERELQYCKDNQIHITHLFEDDYPFLLKECQDAPIVLYSKGNFNWNAPLLTIVGTRKMTSYGKNFTEKLVECLEGKNITVVSGLALGIDGTAHKKAVELNIPTLGVLAHGLKNLYPYQHKMLATRMLSNGGIISEFSLDVKPDRSNFIQRNRIIAGLSPVSVIVESAYGGGAISTIKFANSYNREIFALPGKITDVVSQGCNRLIRNLEAQIITRPEDILEYFGEKTKKTIQAELFIELNAEEKEIIRLLKDKGRYQIDALALELNMPTYRLMPVLLELELKNLIKPLPGKFFELM
ncbi:MAG: DNA-processing protein DprA [Flavobacteriaceae bacterium]|jgi:DNA processing protein|nr:DNA-processing protein DprA [Flavobacteriaceae bacterium]